MFLFTSLPEVELLVTCSLGNINTNTQSIQCILLSLATFAVLESDEHIHP